MAKKVSLKGRELETADENWLVSYADMMTGLVLLFILLYVMTAVKARDLVKNAKTEVAAAEAEVAAMTAKANEAKLSEAQKSAAEIAKTAESPTENVPEDSAPSASKTNETPKNETPAAVQPIPGHPSRQEIEAYLSEHSNLSSVGVASDSSGIKFVIQASVLFDSGSSKVRPESYPLLKELSEYLKTLDNDIIISGHTDNVPIKNLNFQSNWELSSDRAIKVLRYMTDFCSVNPKRFVSIGYGEYRPIANNSSSDGRDKNNRVEILIKT